MQLVILAAGHGRRFGGLKQLAPIGPNDEAIMDYTASAALACGYDEVVLVVRDDIEDEIAPIDLNEGSYQVKQLLEPVAPLLGLFLTERLDRLRVARDAFDELPLQLLEFLVGHCSP